MSEIEDSELKLKAQKMLSNMVEYELPPTQVHGTINKVMDEISVHFRKKGKANA